MTTDEDRYRVVRFFTDHASSPLWFSGPLEYEEAHLSPELQTAMQAWERYYYDHVGFGAKTSPELARDYDAEGRRLAQALADELGAPFEINHLSEAEPGTWTRFRSDRVATNAEAAAAFTALADAERADDERLERLKAEARENGEELTFSLVAPVTGKTYRPGP